MTATSGWFEEAFAGQTLLGILRGFDPGETVRLAELAWRLGVRCVEVPVQDERGRAALRATVEAAAGRPVGAGTVTTPERLHAAVQAGAAFTVAPGLDPELAEASRSAGLPHLPGVATPSEVALAERIGLRWVKAFPAAALGTAWFSAIRGPFPGMRFVATGGMTAASVTPYLDAGASVIALGSGLADLLNPPITA
ncbi:bifunctional 4-hydroxy-2-oxoglutarate aldolase/2-dehydro-3-deoxy-phosphogluconate aldolase [Sciscionella sediminilitoris]|uniref:bifunctional 4-hydroxy-2-oxoglutarate aldolase/2-dehydro-3-deoxy-phosphogluconate aldolase n=1 Tax=Sciscionella sediminilitoris TaxID=1445613 RepID=UPI0004DF02FB|nr:bifunctional 4-hydroxy-2-oxoglutarate aldolase/2-dehydro-3-deoxy-phosphogluconate aldolase [Sciscionella sp. SE31]